MRVVGGIILGFLVFGLSPWVLFVLFRITKLDPHPHFSAIGYIIGILWGVLFALLAGWVASFIEGRPDLMSAWILAALMAISAIASMILMGGSWVSLAGLVLIAPSVVVGGWLYRLRINQKGHQA
jgi:CHASE2 domain-containing sensor protein